MGKAKNTHDLLIEIGCEELPPKNLKKMQECLTEGLSKNLQAAALSFKEIQGFATPRRITARITQLSTHQADRLILKKGPAKTAAYDKNGHPTKAALGFAESCSVSIDALTLQETDKGAWLVFEQKEIGKATTQLLPKIIQETLDTLPLGKRMRWGSTTYTFVRPVHWVVLLFNNKIIETDFFGIKAGNKTYGHRFHYPKPLTLTSPKKYETLLETKGFVIADFEKRRATIASEIKHIAEEHRFHPIISPALLDEVTGLVEWPVVLLGSFQKSFLEIPQEALISSMQTHQKCFPVMDNNKKLLPKFLIVSNIQSSDPKSVIAGNESVMQARLADAAFYYRVDKEVPLYHRREGLKQVVFQTGLGSLWDKSERIAHLAKIIARQINAEPIYTERASHLCKADLLTQMVGEFPELQGIMGRYYALHDSEPETVARAIEEHYYPRFAQDILPTTLEGSAVAIADRIDSLVGIFGLGTKPTGDKDPFALRRQAMGILRILVEKQLDLDLLALLTEAKESYSNTFDPAIIKEILDFCFERLRVWYQDQGISARIFEAVLAKRPTNPLDFHKRLQAVNHFKTLKEAEALASANKRVQNILSKSDITLPTDHTVDKTLLKEAAEKKLEQNLSHKEKEIAPLLKRGNYTDALIALASLRESVDQFFSTVRVMVEDPKLRNNRLRLLNRLRSLFLEIADISLL